MKVCSFVLFSVVRKMSDARSQADELQQTIEYVARYTLLLYYLLVHRQFCLFVNVDG